MDKFDASIFPKTMNHAIYLEKFITYYNYISAKAALGIIRQSIERIHYMNRSRTFRMADKLKYIN